MAINFDKATALSLPDFVNGAASGTKYKLPDEQMKVILQMINAKSYLPAYGSGIVPLSATTGSITIQKSVGAAKPKKKGAGTAGSSATPNTGASGGLSAVSVYFARPDYVEDGFQKVDTEVIPTIASAKFYEILTDFNRDHEVQGFQALAFSTNGTVIPKVTDIVGTTAGVVTTSDIQTAKNIIVNAVHALRASWKPENGIRYVDEKDVFIELNPQLFNALVNEQLIQDQALSVFEQGLWRVGMMGGIVVRENIYIQPATKKFNNFAAWYTDSISTTPAGTSGLQSKDFKPVYGLIGTKFTAVAPKYLVAATIGKLGLSEDTGIYIEYCHSGDSNQAVNGATLIYPELIIPLTAATVLV